MHRLVSCSLSPARRPVRAARTRWLALIGAAALVTATASASQAGEPTWPDRPVKIIVPFTPGGAADVYARLVGQQLSALTGNRQPIVIDNRAGAGGVIGTDVAAKSPADGNSLVMVTVGHAVNPFIYAKLPFDTRKDLVPVGVVAKVPSVIVTGPALKGQRLADLLARARQAPDTLSYGSSGTGSTSHVSAALIESMAGVRLSHVPYKGAAPALQDVMADRVTLSVDIITSSLPLISAGKLHPVAVTGAQRAPTLPHVPTAAESGLPGYDFVAWYMLLAPANTPRPVLEQINAALRKVSETPEFRTRIEDTGASVVHMDLAQSTSYLQSELQRWERVVKDRQIKSD